MIPVKICGITSRKDACAAISHGVQALGFVMAPSLRQVTAATVREITAHISPLVIKVGVFVNEDPWVIKELLRDCRLDLAQLHGEETPEDCEILAGRVIKTFKAGQDLPDPVWKEARLRGILIDTYSATACGGTGQTWDWSLVAAYRSLGWPLILAGGLNAANIGAAIHQVHPDGLDLSSGVEVQPGVKDERKISELMQVIHGL